MPESLTPSTIIWPATSRVSSSERCGWRSSTRSTLFISVLAQWMAATPMPSMPTPMPAPSTIVEIRTLPSVPSSGRAK